MTIDDLTLIDCGMCGERLVCRTCGEGHYPDRMRTSVLARGIRKGQCGECGAPIGEDVVFFAGRNQPGCLPQEPFEEFETFEQARDYLMAELEQAYEQAHAGWDPHDVVIELDAMFEPVMLALHDALAPCALYVNGWVYEIQAT